LSRSKKKKHTSEL